MQEAGSGFQSGRRCCVSVQGLSGIGLLCSPLVLGDDGSSDVCVWGGWGWGGDASEGVEAQNWHCLYASRDSAAGVVDGCINQFGVMRAPPA